VRFRCWARLILVLKAVEITALPPASHLQLWLFKTLWRRHALHNAQSMLSHTTGGSGGQQQTWTLRKVMTQLVPALVAADNCHGTRPQLGLRWSSFIEERASWADQACPTPSITVDVLGVLYSRACHSHQLLKLLLGLGLIERPFNLRRSQLLAEITCHLVSEVCHLSRSLAIDSVESRYPVVHCGQHSRWKLPRLRHLEIGASQAFQGLNEV